MAVEHFKDGSILSTGKDMYEAFARSLNKRNNYKKSCDFCKHKFDSWCEGCEIQNTDLACSCHINPPCSKCVNDHFEPTEYLINYKNHKDKREKWECFPTTKEIFNKFEVLEKEGFGLHAEILTTNEVAIYLEKHFLIRSNHDAIEICRVEFKNVSQKMIINLFKEIKNERIN